MFTPADGYQFGSGPLKDAITSCLSETGDGSCPTFAASNDATGNPYGVMGDWDVSRVTRMANSTSTSVSTLFIHWMVSTDMFFI